MFSIYIDRYALSKICKENANKQNIEEQSPWYRIIVNQNEVYTNIASRLADINEYDNKLTQLDNSNSPDVALRKELVTFKRLAALRKNEQTTVLPCTKVDIDSINPSNPSTLKVVANDPCAVYLLNITPEDAAKIQKEYGVICQSTQKELNDNPLLTGDGVTVNPKKGNGNYGWLRTLKKFKGLPSSGIIINDRNLFSNDEVTYENGQKKERILGIQNVGEILNCIIPKQYNGGSYHVFICSDITKNDSTHVTFELVTNKLEDLRQKLLSSRKKIKIDIELFVFMSQGQVIGHEDTHNRRILSNYYIFTFEHKICAFNGNISLCTQSINGQKLFHTGLTNDGNDPAEKLHRDMISDFSDFLSAYINIKDPEIAKNLDKAAKYSINGVIKKPSQLQKLINRILF